RRKRTARFTGPAGLCRRPFLESLESRTLPSVSIATPGLPDAKSLAANTGLMNDPGGSQGGGQSSGPQQTPGNKGSALNGSGQATQLDVQSGGPLSVQTLPAGSLTDI